MSEAKKVIQLLKGKEKQIKWNMERQDKQSKLLVVKEEKKLYMMY
jgi:hypothetical protein